MHALTGTGAPTVCAVLQTPFQTVSVLPAPMGKHRIATRQRAKTARQAPRAPPARVSNAWQEKKLSHRHNQHLVRTAVGLKLVVMAHAHPVMLANIPPPIARPASHVTPASTGPTVIQQARALRAKRVYSLMVAQPTASRVPSERPEIQARATHVSLAKKELQTMRQLARSVDLA